MTIRFSVLYTHPEAGEGENISSKSISTDSQNGSLFGLELAHYLLHIVDKNVAMKITL